MFGLVRQKRVDELESQVRLLKIRLEAKDKELEHLTQAYRIRCDKYDDIYTKLLGLEYEVEQFVISERAADAYITRLEYYKEQYKLMLRRWLGLVEEECINWPSGRECCGDNGCDCSD